MEEEKKIEERILDLLSTQLLSVRKIAKILNMKKHVVSKILERLKNEGKLELFKVGKSYVYTLKKGGRRELKKERKKKSRLKEQKLPEIIGIVSGKGGVGKTTVSINLAYLLQMLGKDVVAFDGDVRTCGMGLYLGNYNFPTTINEFLNGKANLEDIIHTCSGIKILPAALVTKEIDIKKILRIFKHPSLRNKLIIADCAPGLEKNVTEMMKICSKLIIVTTPDLPSLANAMKLSEIAKMYEKEILGIIINRRKRKSKNQLTEQEIKKILDVPILGVIPEDENIQNSMFYRSPVTKLYPLSPSSLEFNRIAHNLLGLKYKKPSKLEILFKSLFGRFK